MSVDLATGSVRVPLPAAPRTGASRSSTPASDSMTGGRLGGCRARSTERFLLTYGDGLSDVPIDAVVAHHEAHRRRWPPSPPSTRRRGSARWRSSRTGWSPTSARSRRTPMTGSTAGTSSSSPTMLDLDRGRRRVVRGAPLVDARRSSGQLGGLRARRLLDADGHPARARRAEPALGVRGTHRGCEQAVSDELTERGHRGCAGAAAPRGWCRSSTSASSRWPTRWRHSQDDAQTPRSRCT